MENNKQGDAALEAWAKEALEALQETDKNLLVLQIANLKQSAKKNGCYALALEGAQKRQRTFRKLIRSCPLMALERKGSDRQCGNITYTGNGGVIIQLTDEILKQHGNPPTHREDTQSFGEEIMNEGS